MKPRLSILLPAMLGYEAALTALGAWEMQTCRDQLEILILCPDHLGPTEAQTAALSPGQVIVPVGPADLHEARAIGIQQASGDYILLAEDHWTHAFGTPTLRQASIRLLDAALHALIGRQPPTR